MGWVMSRKVVKEGAKGSLKLVIKCKELKG